MTFRDSGLKYKRFGWLLVVLFLAVLAFWIRFKLNPQRITFWHIVLETLIFGVISYLFSRLLKDGKIKDKRRYHTAILSAFSVSMVLFFVSMFRQYHTWHLGLFFLHMTSSFCAVYVESNIMKGWWENNAPPPPEIEKDVLVWHQAYMGPKVRSPFGKRFLDIVCALISIIISFPVWLVIIVLIWWEDPGPVLFVKNSVGKGGVNFKQYKFRSMILNAEKETGPISGYENDERVLFFGSFLRKTALDELPQLINILVGDMSYVGPRPQRTVLVHGYLQQLPLYARRHRVRPGLAGLAQVVDSYDISPEEKLAWDLVYIENATIWLDFKLLLSAFFLVFALRWMSDTDAELKIRRLLNIQKPGS